MPALRLSGRQDYQEPTALPTPVIFDFDFTLADSSEGAIECIGHALGTLGLRAAPDEIRHTIGLSLDASLEQLAGRLGPEDVQKFSRAFVERADQVMAPLTRIYDFVPAMVAELRRRDCTLGIVSTKFRYRIETILAREGLTEFFQVIIGGEDVTKHKPNPACLELALERMGATAPGAIYVGDHPVDGQAARAARLPFVATLTGVFGPEVFAEFEPLAIVSNVSELPAVLSLRP